MLSTQFNFKYRSDLVILKPILILVVVVANALIANRVVVDDFDLNVFDGLYSKFKNDTIFIIVVQVESLLPVINHSEELSFKWHLYPALTHISPNLTVRTEGHQNLFGIGESYLWEDICVK